MSVEYYAKLERGNLAGVSPGVLEAVARVLRLDEAERAHLQNLAQAADGSDALARPRRRRGARDQWKPHRSLQWTLDAITAGPAFVRNGRMDILASNRLADVAVAILRTEAGRNPYDKDKDPHDLVGELTLAYEGLELAAEPGLTLTVYAAEPGSPSEEALRLLASWAATDETPAPSRRST